MGEIQYKNFTGDQSQSANNTYSLKTESGLTPHYSYEFFRAEQLLERPDVIDAIRVMLLAQPAERFKGRFPKFPIHEEPERVITRREKLGPRLKKKVMAQRDYVEGYLEEITTQPDVRVLIVYDENHNIAVLADAYNDDRKVGGLKADVLRAYGSLPGDNHVTTFAFERLYQHCFEDPAVQQVSAFVHRNNDSSRRRMYSVLEHMEANGYPVNMNDGMYLHEDAIRPSMHWRSYNVKRRPQ